LVIAYYGTLRLGCVVVMSSPVAKTSEIVRQAQRSGADVLVTLTQFESTATAVKAQSRLRHIVYANVKDYLPLYKRAWSGGWLNQRDRHRLKQPLGEANFHWRRLLRQQSPIPPEVEVTADDIAVIQFTSGTTDEPKGITLTHYNLVANTIQTRSWIPTARDGKEAILCVVPFSHVYGMTAAMNVAISLGASMVLLPNFDAEEVLQHIRQYRPSLFPGVPTMYVALNNFPGVRKYEVQSIRACISGAAPLPIEVKEAFEKLTKGKLVEGYGLSEASPVTHANPIGGRNKAGSIGIPLPNTEAKIVDLKDGHSLPPGQIGELVVRGPQVMGGGYWMDEAATAEVIDAEGWLHTNDIGRMDEDGYFQIISRRQDIWHDDTMLAFPRDVEEVIYELPEVNEAVVVAIANQPVAFVCLKPKSRLPAQTIIAFCRRRLPPNYVPRLVIFTREFPRNFVGKVLRRELISQYEQQLTAEAGSVGDHLAGLGE
jgi:long-chain acyl-CoA synthetase